MSENTTKGIEMDKERIAELREEIARNKATGYHDEGIGIFDSPTMDAAIDALEAAQAELATAREALLESLEAHQVTEAEGGALQQANTEIDRLRAELAALRGQAGGVVPEPTADEWREIAENARSADMVDFLAGAAAYGLWLRGKALPSPRVLREGMEPGSVDPVDVANRAQLITGRSIWPGTVEAILSVLPSSRVAGEGEGVTLIALERRRQMEKEGWTPKHDDEHDAGELAAAARCYAMEPGDDPDEKDPPEAWPESWHPSWWKPTPHDRARELAKAGALIAAEIDRLKRKALRATKGKEAATPATPDPAP